MTGTLLSLTLLLSTSGAQSLPPDDLPPVPQVLPPQPLPALAGTELPLVRDENLVTFDPALVDLRWQDQRWLLVHGAVVLKDFGRREEEAREAWRLIRDLRLSQMGTIGGPQPVLEYWLADGQPPLWLPRGLRILAVNSEAIQVEKTQGQWVLREPTRLLCNFGIHEKEARQALAVIRKYGFNQVGVIGQGVPSMLVFAARPDAAGQQRAIENDRARAVAANGQKEGAAPTKKEGPPTVVPTSALPPLRPAGQAGRGGVQGQDLVRRGANRWASNWSGPQPAVDNVAIDRVPFDWRQVQVARDQNGWKVVAGSYTLASFGQNERDARLALAAVYHFRANEHVHIGSPEPVASYFLSSGQVPRGMMVGLFSERFEPDQVRVRELAGRYYLANGNHPIFECGAHPDEAAYLQQLIQINRIDHLCRIGPPDRPGLTFFVRSH